MVSLTALAGVFLAGVVVGFWLLVAVCAASERDPGRDP
ncbi:hypothetical protein SAMN04489712_10413 [Thermomonospora echinospora]|uniref:Uncharacterized protein n=1 Tax=Thermomonospora echinospora TaxID=1992 RepID=A0A1H5YIS5_9ACTN|nr:hypothetical protein SAMN04489712_10413 [Thermomonospora echinospora]